MSFRIENIEIWNAKRTRSIFYKKKNDLIVSGDITLEEFKNEVIGDIEKMIGKQYKNEKKRFDVFFIIKDFNNN